MTRSYWNSGCASLRRRTGKDVTLKKRGFERRIGEVSTIYLIFGGRVSWKLFIKADNWWFVAFWVIKKKPCKPSASLGTVDYGRERIVSLLVDCTNLLQQRPSPFLARWGCKEIGCFQCCYNWVGIYHEPCPVGRSSDSDPTFRKSTTGVKAPQIRMRMIGSYYFTS